MEKIWCVAQIAVLAGITYMAALSITRTIKLVTLPNVSSPVQVVQQFKNGT